MPEVDYYKMLGVSKNATNKEIGDAYRNIAKKNHPDKNPGNQEAAEKFKRAAEAFEILNDTEKRKQYDQFGTTRPMASGFPGGFHNPFSIFESFFGHGRQPQQKGEDFETEVNINLEEAYTGCEKKIVVELHDKCEKCDGTGAKNWIECTTCHGAGSVRYNQGSIIFTTTCADCGGRARKPSGKCGSCHGLGKTKKPPIEQAIRIPAGIEDGMILQMRGRGENCQHGISGDLLCQVHIELHPLFVRQGHDLHCLMPITFSQTMLGHELELPLLSGKTCMVSIKAGTTPGSILRLKNHGMPIGNRSNKTHGDLLIKVQIVLPDSPSEDYVEALNNLTQLDKKQEYSQIVDFNNKIKKLNAK